MLALYALAPHLVSDFHSRDLAQAGVFFIAIVGLNILTGYTGQISLGHGALMAVGGYTTAALAVHEHWRDVWTIPLAGIAAGVVGFLIGLPALRLSGIYLALATFAFAVAMPSLLKKFSGLTGGGQGLRLLEQAPLQVTGLSGTVTVFGHSTTQNHFLYYLTWGIGLVGFVIAWLIVRGRLGRTFRAVRDSEVAAASVGDRPRPHEDARLRDQRRLRRRRGRAARDPGRDRQPALVHLPALDPAPRRHGRRRPGLAPGDGGRRLLRRVPARPLDPRLEQARRAGLRLRRRDHPRDDPAADRRGRSAAPGCETPNNPAIPSSLEGL